VRAAKTRQPRPRMMVIPCHAWGVQGHRSRVGVTSGKTGSALRRRNSLCQSKRELPRIPFVKAGPSTRAEALARDDSMVSHGRNARVSRGPSTSAAKAAASAQDDTRVFWAFVKAGRRLVELHVNYEQQTEYPLEHIALFPHRPKSVRG
jgi:hypothetical protein